jgi:hypothetical protein
MNEELIKQTIEFGSIFESIEFNIFGYQELMDYLGKYAKEMPIEQVRICYMALLRYYPPVYHYSYGKHLLSLLPQDAFLNRAYVIMGGSPEFPLNKDEPHNNLWSLVFDNYTEIVNDDWNEEIEKTSLLCNKLTPKLAKKELLFRDQKFIRQLFDYRCDKVITALPLCGFPNKTTKINYIETDWFDKYPNIKTCYEPYILRVNFLRENAPLYFQKMCDNFQSLLAQLTLGDFEKLDLNLLKITSKCFPTQFTSVDLKDEYTKITIYPLTVRAYLLGFPCYPKVPQKDEIDDALRRLSEMGIPEYVKSVLPKDSYDEKQIANTEDTLFEDPQSYSPMDRIDIQENGKIYRFTRPEFNKLLTDKTNFWTKCRLTYSDIYTLSLRVNMCKTINLPYSDTLASLIEKACKGILYQIPETTQPNPPPATSNLQINHETLVQMFSTMMNMSLQNITYSNGGQEGDHEDDHEQVEELSEGEIPDSP